MYQHEHPLRPTRSGHRVEIQHGSCGMLPAVHLHVKGFYVPNGVVVHVSVGGWYSNHSGLHTDRGLVGGGRVG